MNEEVWVVITDGGTPGLFYYTSETSALRRAEVLREQGFYKEIETVPLSRYPDRGSDDAT